MKIKLSQQEMDELIIRTTIISTKEKELELLKAEKQIFWQMFCSSHKIDPSKMYRINIEALELEIFDIKMPTGQMPQPPNEVKVAPPSTPTNSVQEETKEMSK